MIEIYNKIRDCSGVKLHGWYDSSVGIIRKPNSCKQPKPLRIQEELEIQEEKVAEIKETKNMAKLLLVLDSASPINRVIRRAVAMGIISLISVVIATLSETAPGYIIPIVVAVLAGLDKLYREVKESK